MATLCQERRSAAIGRSLLVGTSARDPITLAAIVALLIGVSLAACAWPARRAMRLDPAAALRKE